MTELQKEFEATGYASWINSDLYPDGKIYTQEYTQWLERQVLALRQPPVSGELLFNAKCCANCKHFIDKWPYKSECNFHGNKANITHAEEQCCDNWEKL